MESTKEGNGADAAATTLLINSNNPTVVATWILDKPSQAETSKVMRLRRPPLESLGTHGDHRVKVPEREIIPGGRYAAVCKLFLGFSNKTEDEYVWTGWLIENDLIATAGHCTYESWGQLRYIKVYFGYNGPDSVNAPTCAYRYGTIVATPSEYLKARSYQHDVGFIRLNQKVDAIKPVQYVDTPLKADANLGVVGFPQDRDFGNHMYEHWQDVSIDLAQSDNLLNYKIDTTGGQSGSPVFMDGLTAAGVHIAGGYPNIGSVIGKYGNVFKEYILALRVRAGYHTALATVVPVTKGQHVGQGFQMIRIDDDPKGAGKQPKVNNHPNGTSVTEAGTDPDAGSELADQSSGSAVEDLEGNDDEEASDDNAEDNDVEMTLDRLFGGRSKEKDGKPTKKKPTKKKSKVLKGLVILFPARLRLSEAAPDAPPPTDTDIKAAVQKQVDNPDVPTLFFINFPPNFGGSAQKDFQKLYDSVQSWQAWSSSICEGSVQQQINKKALSDGEGAPAFARSAYRAKVFDYLFRQATWFSKTFDQNMTNHIQCDKVDFHTEILKAMLKGFAVPSTVYSPLEKIVDQIGENITLGKQVNASEQQFWIQLTRYDYHKEVGKVQPVILVIGFSIDEKMATYTAGKSSYTTIDITINFGQYQADFIDRIYAKIQKAIDKTLIDAGKKLVSQKTVDIPV